MSKTWFRRLLPVAALAALSAVPARAQADGSDVEVERIAKAGHSLKWTWTPPGKDKHYGHAEVLIHAPAASVRTILLDYAHYKDMASDKVRTTHVIAKKDGNTDVYWQLPIMNDLFMAWYVARYAPPKVVSPGTEVIEGQMLKGNIHAMNSIWTMRAVNDSWTLLELDLLGVPNVLVPEAWQDEGMRDAAAQAVDAVHDKAQGDPKWVTWKEEAKGDVNAAK